MKGSVVGLIVMMICISAGNCYSLNIKGVNINGFFSQGFVRTTDNNVFSKTEDGSFQLNELGINFNKDITDRLRFGVQLFSKDYGETGNNEVNIDWAYMDYHFEDWLGFRAGKIKVPHGLYNQTRDIDMLRTSVFLPQSVYPEILRDSMLSIIGGGFYGHIDLKEAGGVSYQAALGKQHISPSERTMQAFMDTTSNNDMVQNDSIDVDSKYAGSIAWHTSLDGLKFSWSIGNTKLSALSHAIEDSPPVMSVGTKVYQDFNKFQYIVYSAEYAWKYLTISGEYMRTKRAFSIAMGDRANKDNEAIESNGWYVGSSYRLTDWFVLGSYYSKNESKSYRDDADGFDEAPSDAGDVYPDDGEAPPESAGAFFDVGGEASDVPGREYQKDLCLTTRFDINNHVIFKLEGHSIRGTNGLSPLDNPEDANGNRWTNKWKMFATKITVRF